MAELAKAAEPFRFYTRMHQYLSPEPPNDFAYWVRKILGEEELGKRLANIDTIQYSTIRSLREKIIEEYLKERPESKMRFPREGELHFKKSVSFILPTDHISYNLGEFVEILKRITITIPGTPYWFFLTRDVGSY